MFLYNNKNSGGLQGPDRPERRGYICWLPEASHEILSTAAGSAASRGRPKKQAAAPSVQPAHWGVHGICGGSSCVC
jgi:hypothetical protein